MVIAFEISQKGDLLGVMGGGKGNNEGGVYEVTRPLTGLWDTVIR